MLDIDGAKEIWQQVKKKLRQEAGKTVYNNWLDSLKLISYVNGKIEIASHSEFHKNWIEPRYGNRIKSLFKAANKEVKSVIFIVDESIPFKNQKVQGKKSNNLHFSSPLDLRYTFPEIFRI